MGELIWESPLWPGKPVLKIGLGEVSEESEEKVYVLDEAGVAGREMGAERRERDVDIGEGRTLEGRVPECERKKRDERRRQWSGRRPRRQRVKSECACTMMDRPSRSSASSTSSMKSSDLTESARAVATATDSSSEAVEAMLRARSLRMSDRRGRSRLEARTRRQRCLTEVASERRRD